MACTKKQYCGPAIDEAIAATLEQYVKMWQNTNLPLQYLACTDLVALFFDILTLSNEAWDIYQPDKAWGGKCGTCKPTPTGKDDEECYKISGVNQWWPDVDYALFGAFASMCSFTSLGYTFYYLLSQAWKAAKHELNPYVPLWYTVGWNYTTDLYYNPNTANFNNTAQHMWKKDFGRPVDNEAYANCSDCEDPPLPHKSLQFRSPIGSYP